MLNERIEKYTKQFGVRFSRRAKKRFDDEITKEFSQLGYERKSIEGRKWLNKAYDIFFGNMKNAKTLIVVPYDTPERKFWHKVLYFPFDGNRTANKTLLATFVPIVAIYAVILVFVFFGGKLFTSLAASTLVSICMFLLLIFLVYFMVHGIHNAKNFTRNSASIVAALEIAEGLNKDERKKTAFLFTDKNKARFLGSDLAVKELKAAGKNPNVILLDCIGTGSTLQIGYKPQNRKLAQEVVKSNPDKKNIDVIKIDENMQFQSAVQAFEKAIVIARGEVDGDGRLYLVGTGTGKDNHVEAEHIAQVSNMVCNYIHKCK